MNILQIAELINSLIAKAQAVVTQCPAEIKAVQDAWASIMADGKITWTDTFAIIALGQAVWALAAKLVSLGIFTPAQAVYETHVIIGACASAAHTDSGTEVA